MERNRELSYELMHELRKALKLHSYEYRDKEGIMRAVVQLNYITADGKVHQLAETELTL